MRRFPLFLAVAALVGLAVGGATAAGKAPTSGSCSGGDIGDGSYANYTVTGDCTVPDGVTLTISGNLTLKPGATFDAVHMSTVSVGGNILVGKGALLGLGCTPASNSPFYAPCSDTTPTTDVVGGNIVADQPLTMYIDGDTIHGSLVSNGGGPGPSGPFLNLPIKDNSIGGNLVVQGWHGGWWGVIRNDVGGNVIVANNESVVTEGGPGTDSDANEIQSNFSIGGNLICHGNSPHAQINPADGGGPNVVGGKKIGECAGL